MLKVDDAKRCNSHSSILALLVVVHSKGNVNGRTGTTARSGQEHKYMESAVSPKPPAFILSCLSVDLDGGCWVTGGPVATPTDGS